MLKLLNHNIILPKYLEIVKKKGSSLIFSASGGRDKEKKNKPAEKIAVGSEGEAEGGCGGNSASPEPKRSPAALLVQSRVPQKSFLFLLEEKIGRAQIKKCRENFFAGQRALASGGGAERQNSQSGFSSKKVRISSNKHHHIELVASLGASPLASAGSFASKSKGFLKSIPSRPAARRRFTNEICIARRAMSRFFSFAKGGATPQAKFSLRFFFCARHQLFLLKGKENFVFGVLL